MVCRLSKMEFSFLINLIFQRNFKLRAKLSKKVQRFPIYLLPSIIYNLPHYQSSPVSSTFVSIGEPALIRHHLTFVVNIIIHSWCYTFRGFGQMVLIPPYIIAWNSFTALQIWCVPPIRLLPAPNLWQPLIFSLSLQLL